MTFTGLAGVAHARSSDSPARAWATPAHGKSGRWLKRRRRVSSVAKPFTRSPAASVSSNDPTHPHSRRRLARLPRLRRGGSEEAEHRRHPRRRPGLGRPERQRQHQPAARRTSTRWHATARCSSASTSARSARRRGPSSSPAATTRAAACAASRPAASGSNLDERTDRATRSRRRATPPAAFGKWHNGTQYPYHPNARGFDEYYGFTSGHWGEYFDPPLDHNGQAGPRQGLHRRRPDRPRDRVHRDERDAAPFFCYLAVQHAALADAGAGPVLGAVRERRR